MQAAISRFFRQEYIFVMASLATLIVYSGFAAYGHISWDDPEMVFRNEAVHQFDIRAFFTRQFVGNYIPVTMILHSLTWQLFEGWNAGHHFLNILFHLLNAYLLLLAGRKLFGAGTVSNLAVVLFQLHPLQVESVGWISEFKTVICGTFFFAALLNYLNYSDKKEGRFLLFTFLFFILACLSKPSAVVFPVVMVCMDLYSGTKTTSRHLLILLPFFIIAIVAGIVNLNAQAAAQFINHSHEFPWWQRTAFAGFALLKYFTLFVFPQDLSIIYPYPDQKPAVYVTGFVMLAVLTSICIYLIRTKNHRWLAILLFVLVNLALVLQFIPFGEVLYADRYMYISMAGLGWITGSFVQRLQIKPAYVALGLTVLFSILTYGRSLAWTSALHLYEDILKKYPGEFIALNSAGVECMFLNDDRRALNYLDKAVQAEPGNYKGYYNRGLLLLKMQKPAEAIRSFNQSISLYEYAKAYTGRASAYYQLDDLSKALQDAQHALSLDPTNSKACFVIANCYNNMNRLQGAMQYYNKALQISPNEADYYFKRAVVYGKQQDFASCLADLDICISLKGDYYEAYYWRGVAKVNLKKDPCADLQVAARNNFEPAVNAFNQYCR